MIQKFLTACEENNLNDAFAIYNDANSKGKLELLEQDFYRPLRISLEKANFEIVKFLVESCESKIREEMLKSMDFSAFKTAASYGHWHILDYLLSYLIQNTVETLDRKLKIHFDMSESMIKRRLEIKEGKIAFDDKANDNQSSKKPKTFEFCGVISYERKKITANSPELDIDAVNTQIISLTQNRTAALLLLSSKSLKRSLTENFQIEDALATTINCILDQEYTSPSICSIMECAQAVIAKNLGAICSKEFFRECRNLRAQSLLNQSQRDC